MPVIIASVRPFAILLLLFLTACAPPAKAPVSAPAEVVGTREGAEERGEGTVYVNASALNVRREPSTDADVVAQVKRNVALQVVGGQVGWVQVRLGDGRVGWVAERFVSATNAAAAGAGSGGKRGCESDHAFIETPALTFSELDAHGLVVVEATVNSKGVVTGTKVVSNTTGDPKAGAVAEREIRSAKFAPPIRNCVARSFIFTYRRTF